MSLILQCFLWTLLMFIIQYFIKNKRYYELTRKIPSRYCWPLTLLRCYYSFYKSCELSYMIEQVKTDEGIFKIYLPKLCTVITKPEHFEQLYKSPNLRAKSHHYNAVTVLVGPTGLINSKGEQFKLSKKAFNKGFKGITPELVTDVFSKGSAEMVNSIRNELRPGSSQIKLLHYFEHSTASNVYRAIFGVDPDGHSDWYWVLQQLQTMMLQAAFEDILGTTLTAPWCQTLKRCRKIYTDITNTLLITSIQDLLKFNSGDNPVPNKYSLNVFKERKDIAPSMLYADIVIITAAALDTSASTSSFAIQLLAMHPEMQERVFLEDQAIRNGLDGDQINEDIISKYEYLSRVIKETLRLYPSAPILGRNVDEETKIGNYTLPKGSTVTCHLGSLHRDPNSFPDPNRFDPDRFLPENVEKMHRYAYLPFSFGTRACPGYRFGPQTVLFNVAAIIRNFKVSTKYKSVEDLDRNVGGLVTLVDYAECPVTLEPRTHC